MAFDLKNGWKEFLYFQKEERIGISLLLILIVITGALSAYLSHFSSIDPSYFAQQEEIKAEFKEYEESLMTAQVIKEDSTSEKENFKKNTQKRNSSTKIELGQTIDINSASANTLTRIPGIGDTFAKRIVEYRELLGGFYAVDQLQDIKGITNNKFSQILPFISIKKRHKTIKINSANNSQLEKHPYLKEYHIKAIIALKTNSKIKCIEELAQNENFIAKDIERIEPYLSFD